MKKVNRFVWMMSTVLFLIFSLAFSPNIEAQQVNKLSMGTGGTGGVYYVIGGGIARILSKYMPNTEVTVEVTAGSVDNCKLIHAKKADLGLAQGDVCIDAIRGVDKFGKGRPEDKVRMSALANVMLSSMHFITLKDSPIKTVADFKGKRISTGSPGSGTEVTALRVLEAFGINADKDFKRERLGASESAGAMKDKKLDAYAWNSGVPTSSVLDLAATPGISIKILDLVEALPKLEAKYPGCYFPLNIPKGSYPGVEEVKTVGVGVILFVPESMDAGLAYTILKTLYDHIRPDFVAVHKEAEKMTLQTMVSGIGIPMHPGASKFYKEKGAIK